MAWVEVEYYCTCGGMFVGGGEGNDVIFDGWLENHQAKAGKHKPATAKVAETAREKAYAADEERRSGGRR